MDAQDVGRLLVAVGIGLAVMGGVVLLVGRFLDLGSLPGDLTYRGDDVTVHVPITTMIVVSIVLTLVLNLLLRLFR